MAGGGRGEGRGRDLQQDKGFKSITTQVFLGFLCSQEVAQTKHTHVSKCRNNLKKLTTTPKNKVQRAHKTLHYPVSITKVSKNKIYFDISRTCCHFHI
jgi:hypothetical protein